MKLRYQRLRLDLDFTWAISRNSSDYKENFIVELSENGVNGWGEAAPNIRYGETPDALEAILQGWVGEEVSEVVWMDRINLNELPACLALALDAAWQMYKARVGNTSLAKQIGVDELSPQYPVSFTLPIMPPSAVAYFFDRYKLHRFPYLKVKVGKQTDDDVFVELGQLYQGPILIDGNEAFSSTEELDRHIAFWQKHVLLAAVEQPFPVIDNVRMRELKGKYPFPFLADESVVRGADINKLGDYFDGINIKLQKAGSYREAVRQKNEAKRIGLKCMIGCMVETSMGIWQGLHLAEGAEFVDLDSMLYLKEEPFSWVKEDMGRLLPDSALPATLTLV